MPAAPSVWPRALLAAAGGAAAAWLLLAAAFPSSPAQQWAAPNAAGSRVVLPTVGGVPAAARPPLGHPAASSVPEMATEGDFSSASLQPGPAGMVSAVIGVASALALLAAVAQRLLTRFQPVACSPLVPLALAATAGDRQSDESRKEGISRRDIAPLLTGAVLGPALFGQPASASSLGDFLKSDADATAKAEPAKALADKVAIPNPREWIEVNLPGCLPGREFSRLTAEILSRQGLTPQNTVPCIGVCRDELCQPLVDEIEEEWGDAFNMSSLAGMLTLGKTGMRAAMAHSPVDENGRERYFFMAFPHISVDTAGVGKCTRPGRNKTSSACGALVAFTNEVKSGKVKADDDPLDPEYSFMKAALLDLMPPNAPADLLEITKVAAQASQDQLEQLAAATVDPSKADYAVFVGVLVHEQDIRPKNAKVIGAGRTYLDQVYPTAFYSVVKGRKKDLIWRLDRE